MESKVFGKSGRSASENVTAVHITVGPDMVRIVKQVEKDREDTEDRERRAQLALQLKAEIEAQSAVDISKKTSNTTPKEPTIV